MDESLNVSAIQALAEQGDADAQYKYGWELCNADLPKKDWGLPMHWFRKAAEQGHPKGLWKVGGSFEQIDNEQAVYWYRKSAEAGYPTAQWWLGVKYLIGDGVAQDYEQAYFWFKVAAEGGDPDASRELGAMCEIGEGVAQNWQHSSFWYKIAAIQCSDLLRDRSNKPITVAN